MIFVDSSFWIAHAMARDGRHEDAMRLASRALAEPLTSSNLVVGETWTFIRRRAGY
jgi:predicted nucleic acid-binding protein